jgi:L-aspartate oxidase
VHGANRLASNSLLECLVFGRRAALAALSEPDTGLDTGLRDTSDTCQRRVRDVSETVTPEIRHALWEDAGVIRNADGLERLLHVDALLPRLVAESALARRESRGAHFRSDFPTEDEAFATHVVLTRGEEPRLETWV